MIYLNGKPEDIPEGISLAELVRERQYCLDYIAAELNGEIVPNSNIRIQFFAVKINLKL